MIAATHVFGPGSGRLSVHTGKTGAASRAGHNLLIEVGSWEATLQLGEGEQDVSLTLTADPRSLKVREGSGGIQPLGEDDKANIEQTIDAEVLCGCEIAFRSSSAAARDGGQRMTISGELALFGRSLPLEVDLEFGDAGAVSGTATIKQTDWGVKPYSALFGTLKVLDELTVEIDAELPPG